MIDAVLIVLPSASKNSIVGSSAGSSEIVITVSSLLASMIAFPEPLASTVSSRTIVSSASHLSSSVIVIPGKIVPFIPSAISIDVSSLMVVKSVPLFAVLVFFTVTRPVTVLSVKVVPDGSNFTFTDVALPASSSNV